MPVQENTNSKPSASQNSALPETIHLSDHPSDHRLGFFRYHAGLFMEFIQHPSRIPGDDVLSKLYTLGVLPVLVSSVTLLGSVLKIKNILFKPEKKALTSRWEYGVREQVLDKAWGQLKITTDHDPKFNYDVASLLLCLSSTAYWSAEVWESYETSDEFRDWATKIFKGPKFPKQNERNYRNASVGLCCRKNVIILAFKGTTPEYFQECLSDAALYRRSSHDEECNADCKKVCYRHTSSSFGCGNNCIKVCDKHAKYLDGEVHQGFYDLLFRTTDCKHQHHYTEGPPNSFKRIMETIFMMVYIRRTLFCHPDMVKNLWVTGHSLGGALASIFMARLQTTVCKDDPLVCGLKEDDQEYFVGSTVLEVMTSQFLTNVRCDSVCRRCPQCIHTNPANCNCRRCKMMRMRGESGYPSCCLECWQSEQSEEDRKIIGILEGCTVCKDQSNDTGPGRCENCYSDCGGCGSGTCVSCKVGKYSTYCKDIKNSTLVNLRDCYTFGSPKVGDTEFAKEFATNQEKVHAKGPFKPKYWRVANEYDPVTRLPPTRDGYAGKPASGHKSSLLDYQHIGHLVPLQTKRNRENAINHSTGKEETKLLDKIQAPLRWPRSAADFLIGSLTSHSTSEYNTNLFVCSPVTPDTETADTETADTETAVQDTEIATQDTEIAAQDTETPVRNTEALLQNTVPLP